MALVGVGNRRESAPGPQASSIQSRLAWNPPAAATNARAGTRVSKPRWRSRAATKLPSSISSPVTSAS
jgi:hypothetical protein